MSNLSNKSLTLWGKKNVEDGQQLWLPLVAHLTDTRNVINFLYNQWLSQEQQEFLAQGLSDESGTEIHKLIKFLGFAHDIGKATPAFQTKESYIGDRSLDDQLIENLIRNGFSKLDELQLASRSSSPHNKAGEAILLNFKVPETVAALIGGHHGKPESGSPIDDLDIHTVNYYQSDHDEALKEPWVQVQHELFNYALATSGYHNVTEIPTITQPEAVLLEGLIIMADWLASSERTKNGKELFPLISIDESWNDLDMQKRFEKAMNNWTLNGEWEPQKISEVTDPYKERWGFNARPVQKVMTREIGKTIEPEMIIVEAPMGLGKTEIALVAAEQLAYTCGEDGVFIGLPTQATSNAMFKRVDEWIGELADKQKDKFSVRLMHSKAEFNEAYKELPDAENIDSTGAVTINSWFSGKKSILTKFTIGTIDNLLSMALKQKHLFLKHIGLSGKVVIIDEVHAYDAYMSQYLYKAIKWLGAYHVPIVILSATLPKEKRESLIKAYLKGKYGIKYKNIFKAPTNWENNQAYPLLSILDGCKLKQVSDFPGNSDQKRKKLQVKRINLSDEELIADVLNKISDGGVAGVIVNTVKRAQKLAELVAREGVDFMILHSAFLAPERAKQEERLQQAIGKSGMRPKKLVVIGTQVLEQSLDIDFDVLYTDIAPMDLILQRAGRLHRHEIKRPQELQKPQLFIMGVNKFGDYGAANQSIYHKYLLMKTDYFLKDSINLPNDISDLVQKVYCSETDSEVPEIMAPKADFINYIETEESKAKQFQINKPGKKVIHGWLDRSQTNVDKDEQKASAAVRDIQETIEVVLIKHTAEGDFLLDGRKLEDVADYEIAEQVIRLPSALTAFPKAVEQIIDELEKRTNPYHNKWENSIWLKGVLVLPLNDKLTAKIGKWRIQYSMEFGLSYAKEDDHD
ncbi:CRISPR-associated helicase Cas3' [Lactobacillus sp. ESL0791]|uniref:CRISPR-associated helicase Cas3' n=1 Tax=Lactobacillus sp. ESL0791 TaxID=2983234 RepID=UPI0023F61E10|nr:CRISPR-associated helicase Cas3' [Lactobacillus sp. ESL0791]MDF7639260.1 CRISPR-associated helicase Cas3' [Lactobacillus sp. ESL0791]